MKINNKKAEIVFAQTLVNIRKSKKITQVSCANVLGVTQAQWSAYEVGKSSPSFNRIIEITQALDISLLDLIKKFTNYYEQ